MKEIPEEDDIPELTEEEERAIQEFSRILRDNGIKSPQMNTFLASLPDDVREQFDAMTVPLLEDIVREELEVTVVYGDGTTVVLGPEDIKPEETRKVSPRATKGNTYKWN